MSTCIHVYLPIDFMAFQDAVGTDTHNGLSMTYEIAQICKLR